jgi:hypothetical protein
MRINDEPCPVCGLTYVRESSSDRALHSRVHRQFLLHWRPAATEEIIAQVGDLKIVMVRPLAAEWMRKRVARIARRAHLDTDYDFIPYHGTAAECIEFACHAFVGVIGGQAVTLALLTRRSHVAYVTWSEHDAGLGKPWDETNAMRWTVNFAWTVRDHRRRGYARDLIQRACQSIGVSTADVAWYTPFSETGKALARALAPEGFTVGKGDGPFSRVLR